VRATDVLVLPPDVGVTAVDALDAGLRARLGAEAGDYVIDRRAYRSRPILVSGDGALFLERFRVPSTVTDAVFAHCAERGGSPQQVLEDLLPLIIRSRERALLVKRSAVTARELTPSLRPGARVAGVRVESCVQCLMDVEVYRATDAAGRLCALKMLRPRAPASARRGIEREAIILRRLAGHGAPRLERAGAFRGRRLLVMRWCAGRTVDAAAAALRALHGPLSTPVLRLCADVLDAYARLHARGVIHGDVQQRNVIVGEDGSITVLDFAAARERRATVHADDARIGLFEYLEPECAEKLALDEPIPAPSAAGEQYALAALCYVLATGDSYLEARYVHEEWLAEVRRSRPRTFAEIGLAGAPLVEASLLRALAKRPEERHASVRAFAGAFRRGFSVVRGGRATRGRARRLLDAVVLRYALDRGRVATELCEAPRATFAYGAAGIAFFCYRLAILRGDPTLLPAALAWSRWASRQSIDPSACASAELGIDESTVGPVSLHHRALGIATVHALIAHAAGDPEACNRALAALAREARQVTCDDDLVSGRAGALLACAALIEALPGQNGFDRASVVRLGARLAASLKRALGPGILRASSRSRLLGTAHGGAGVLFAALRWMEATGEAIGEVRKRLDELAELANWQGAAAAWPLALGPGAQTPHTGWCNGSAGYVQLWALAERAYPDGDFGRLAIGAAEHLWQARAAGARANGSLCCGYAGQGFSMLSLYRRDGDRRWLARAETLLDEAIAHAGEAERRHSLYKGDAGIALLAEEIGRPSLSRMPLHEAEGWPRRA